MTVSTLGNGLALTRSQRLVLGFAILILVDFIWVATAEFSKYFFSEKYTAKPYFNTFIRCSVLVIYLSGFLIHRSWWYQCRKDNGQFHAGKGSNNSKGDCEKLIGDPVFVPVKFDSKQSSPATSESEESGGSKHNRSVRFSRVSEVRQMSAIHAEEAVLSRLSYAAYMRAEQCRLKAANRLTVRQICKIAGIFSFVLFFGTLAYHETQRLADSGVVNILLSTSTLFTLALASVFPASNSDRFTLSKLVAVALSIGGIVLMSWSQLGPRLEEPVSVVWPLVGALLLALYLVLIRRRVDHEHKLNMPMFYGFIGLFVLIFLWPGLLILHFTKLERLEWPDTVQWILLVVNGIASMVISNILWLWGCFLTSSLAATLALTLIMPMTAIAGLFINQMPLLGQSWTFYVGVCPVFASFFAVGVLNHYDNCDPVLFLLKKTLQCLFRRRVFSLRSSHRYVNEEYISFSIVNPFIPKLARSSKNIQQSSFALNQQALFRGPPDEKQKHSEN